jgi:predicted nucleotidyltransferase
LEQLYSPLVVQGGPALDELQDLGQGCITRHLYHHYEGFARNQVERFESQSPRRVKTLLYIYRVLLTGIFLLETGEVESNLPRLNETFRLPFIGELIALKQEEQAILIGTDLELHRETVVQLQVRLEAAFQESSLPERPSNLSALSDFLVRVRLEMGRG